MASIFPTSYAKPGIELTTVQLHLFERLLSKMLYQLSVCGCSTDTFVEKRIILKQKRYNLYLCKTRAAMLQCVYICGCLICWAKLLHWSVLRRRNIFVFCCHSQESRWLRSAFSGLALLFWWGGASFSGDVLPLKRHNMKTFLLQGLARACKSLQELVRACKSFSCDI